jgi:hypothetical protein
MIDVIILWMMKGTQIKLPASKEQTCAVDTSAKVKYRVAGKHL